MSVGIRETGAQRPSRQKRRYLVTGASRGIGRAIAVKLARSGTTLFIHGRDCDAIKEVCAAVEEKKARAVPLCYDLRYPQQIAKMVKEIGPATRLDAIIHNAGVAVVKAFETISLEEWETIFAINVTAPFLLTQRLAPRLSVGSSIVNILSVGAKTGFPNWSAYCMSKFALEGFSQSLREELRPRGIRVLNIYPAATNTDIWNSVQGEWPRDRMLLPVEVGDAVAYALSRPPEVVVENIDLLNLTGRL